MTTQEVAAMVESIGLPNAYWQFDVDNGNPAPSLPFVCFYYTGTNDFKADDINYVHIEGLTIEVYTEDKDFGLEERVRAILTAHDFDFEAEPAYIDDEHMYMMTYTMEVVINGSGS